LKNEENDMACSDCCFGEDPSAHEILTPTGIRRTTCADRVSKDLSTGMLVMTSNAWAHSITGVSVVAAAAPRHRAGAHEAGLAVWAARLAEMQARGATGFAVDRLAAIFANPAKIEHYLANGTFA
jgi:hypothetical protein